MVGWWLKRAPEPFLPLNVLANPVMRLGTAATSFAMAVMTGFMIYMPLYFQTVHKLTPTQAGLALIPVIVMTTPGSMASGRAMMHLNRYKLSPYVGLVVATLAVAALVVWPDMPVLWAVVATASSATASAPCSRSPPSACRMRCGGTRSASRPAR